MARRPKYGAKSTVLDGIRFHSKAEARRYGELKLCEKAGEVWGIERQVPYKLHAMGGAEIGTYIADFRYVQRIAGGNHSTVEDVKGYQTALSKWKIKHVEAEYLIRVRITGAASRKRAA